MEEIYLLQLTKDEVEVLSNYLDNKLYKLEESNLKDSKCYPLLYSIRHKLNGTRADNHPLSLEEQKTNAQVKQVLDVPPKEWHGDLSHYEQEFESELRDVRLQEFINKKKEKN